MYICINIYSLLTIPDWLCPIAYSVLACIYYSHRLPMQAIPFVATVPDIQNVHNMFSIIINIGHLLDTNRIYNI